MEPRNTPRFRGSVADALVFFLGAMFIAFKNYMFAGLDGWQTLVATAGLVTVKTTVGVYYQTITEWVVVRIAIGSARGQGFARDLTYAVLQTVTFAMFVALIAEPHQWLRAIGVTFVTSAIMAPFVNRCVLPWARSKF